MVVMTSCDERVWNAYTMMSQTKRYSWASKPEL